MNNLLFYLGFATLITHELDAMTHAEWRLLWILHNLPEQMASDIFVILHVPLLAILLWLTNHESLTVRDRSRIIVTTFFLVHTGLHQRLQHHPDYTFNSLLSASLIYGGGLLGLLYLTMYFSYRRIDSQERTS
jgi:hypothetical protein